MPSPPRAGGARTAGCCCAAATAAGRAGTVPGRALAGLVGRQGNLNYSLTLDTLPLADPLVMLQSLLTGHVPERNAIIGVAIVLAFTCWWAGACIAPGSAR